MIVPAQQHDRSIASGSQRVRVGICCALILACSSAGAAHAQSMWEFDPYRIRLVIAFGASPSFTPELAQRAQQAMLDRVDAYIGAPWQIEASIAEQALRWRVATSLDDIDPTEVIAADQQFDKLWLVSVHDDATSLRLKFREYDVLTQHWGPTLEQACPRVEQLPECLFRGLLAVFAPLAEIESVEDRTAELRWRAGILPTRDSNVRFVAPGDLLLPFLRSTDRDGNTRKIQEIEWTYLVVDDAEGGKARATVYSGLRGPLARRKRGRIQQLALMMRHVPGNTELQALSRTADARPLAGYEVYAYGPASPETQLLGFTDSDGRIEVPPGNSPLRLVLVKSGHELLARLPVVPGAQRRLQVRLIDDAPRLAAEGFIVGLQERLIDVVVRRHVLMARIKLRIDQGKLDEAARLMDELRRMDSQQQFLLAIDQEQQKSLADDPTVQRKIESLFSEARKLVGQYLDPRDVNRTEIALDEARRAQAAAPTAGDAASN